MGHCKVQQTATRWASAICLVGLLWWVTEPLIGLASICQLTLESRLLANATLTSPLLANASYELSPLLANASYELNSTRCAIDLWIQKQVGTTIPIIPNVTVIFMKPNNWGSTRKRLHDMVTGLEGMSLPSWSVRWYDCSSTGLRNMVAHAERAKHTIIVHMKQLCSKVESILSHHPLFSRRHPSCSRIHIWDIIDSIPGNMPSFVGAVFAQNYEQRKLLEKKFVALRFVFVVPHHTSISLPGVATKGMRSSQLPHRPFHIGAVSADVYVDPLAKTIARLHLDPKWFSFKITTTTTDMMKESTIRIHELISSLDIAIIWHASGHGGNSMRVAKPYQRAANAAGTGVPVILSDLYAANKEFVTLRNDLPPYPWIVKHDNASMLRAYLIELTNPVTWANARAHGLLLAECLSMDHIRRLYVTIMMFMAARNDVSCRDT